MDAIISKTNRFKINLYQYIHKTNEFVFKHYKIHQNIFCWMSSNVLADIIFYVIDRYGHEFLEDIFGHSELPIIKICTGIMLIISNIIDSSKTTGKLNDNNILLYVKKYIVPSIFASVFVLHLTTWKNGIMGLNVEIGIKYHKYDGKLFFKNFPLITVLLYFLTCTSLFSFFKMIFNENDDEKQ